MKHHKSRKKRAPEERQVRWWGYKTHTHAHTHTRCFHVVMQSWGQRWLQIYLSELEDPQSRDRDTPATVWLPGSTKSKKRRVKSKIKH